MLTALNWPVYLVSVALRVLALLVSSARVPAFLKLMSLQSPASLDLLSRGPNASRHNTPIGFLSLFSHDNRFDVLHVTCAAGQDRESLQDVLCATKCMHACFEACSDTVKASQYTRIVIPASLEIPTGRIALHLCVLLFALKQNASMLANLGKLFSLKSKSPAISPLGEAVSEDLATRDSAV